MFNPDKKISMLIFIFAAFFFGFLIYSNILYAPFIFDDYTYIKNNSSIEDFSIFKHLSGTRYIGFLSFAVNYYFGGLNTFGYHLVNIIIHILNAILVYFLVKAMGNGLEAMGVPRPSSTVPSAHRLLPIACSLIFLVHPIQTQAVTYIFQRVTSLATFFYLLALVLYAKARGYGLEAMDKGGQTTYRLSPIAYSLSLISTILAMKTKELSFTLPFIIILCEFTFFNGNGQQTRTRFLYLIPYLLTLTIIPLDLFFINKIADQGGLQTQLQGELTNKPLAFDYLLTQFNVIVTYIRLLFVPVNQHFAYDYPISKSIFEIKTFLSFILLASIFGFAIYLYLKSRKTSNPYGVLISFGIFWFFITLSIVSAIPVSGTIFEHWLYLPSIGFILSVVTSYFYFFDHIENKTIRQILFFIGIAAILLLSIAAYKRNIIYKDGITILLDELKYVPNSSNTHNRLGGAYLEKKMFDEAEREYKKAGELAPVDSRESAESRVNLGIVYENKGLLDAAEREYMATIKVLNKVSKYLIIDNRFIAAVHTKLGGVYAKKGLLDQSLSEYKEALIFNPSAAAHINLGNAYYSKGWFEQSFSEYKEALKLEPSSTVYNKFGVIYYEKGMFDKAIEAFKEAIKLEKGFAAPYYSNIGFMYFKKNDYDKAIEMHQKAIELEPKYANAYLGLAEVYEKKGMKDRAIEYYKECIKYANPKEQFVERAKERIVKLGAE